MPGKPVAENLNGQTGPPVPFCLLGQQGSHIAADPGNSEKSAFVIQDAGDHGEGQPRFFLNEEQNVGIKVATSCSHDEAVKWGEAHACIDTFPFTYCADAGSVPQMGSQQLKLFVRLADECGRKC